MTIAPPAVEPSIRPLVRAMVRALKAMGYYDERHPVFVTTRKEAAEALRVATKDRESLTLGCGGAHVVYDVEAPPLTDDVAYALARAMFDRSIVAIRLSRGAGQEDLGALLGALAEHPERVRDQGGVRSRLAADGASGVAVLEVDFGALFAGTEADLGAMVGGDPIVERALREVLRSKDAGAGRVLSVRLDQLGSVESLGGFLDELIGGAAPGVVADDARSGRRPDGDGLTAATIADLAAEAFVANQSKLRGSGAGPEEIAKSARVLGDALVRLHPAARLGLLRKLAGAERPTTPAESDAIGALSGAIDDRLIVDAIVSVLFDERSDLDAINEIGNLIRRLRPVEKERLELLESLDATLAQKGRSMSGMVWQEIRSRALDRQDLGYLRIALDELREGMVAAAGARLRGDVHPVTGQEILQAHRGGVLEVQAASVLHRILSEERDVGQPILTVARDLIERLDQAGAEGYATALLGTLVRRVDLEERARQSTTTKTISATPTSQGTLQSLPQPSSRTSIDRPSARPTLSPRASNAPTAATSTPPAQAQTSARALVGELLTGPAGGRWTRRLIEAVPVSSPFMAEILLHAISGTSDPGDQDALVEKLSRLDAAVLEQVGAQVAAYDRVPAIALIRAAARTDADTALKIARLALRDAQVSVKEAALKALIDVRDPRAVTFLAVAAGHQGEDAALRLFGLAGGKGPEERRLHGLQLIAVGALGYTRSAAAVPPLEQLLFRSRFFTNKTIEELRAEAARALATNGTPEAAKVLEKGLTRGKRRVREACRRATAAAVERDQEAGGG